MSAAIVPYRISDYIHSIVEKGNNYAIANTGQSYWPNLPASVTIEFPATWMKDEFVNYMLITAQEGDGFVERMLAYNGVYIKLVEGDKTLKFVRTGAEV
jgi:hypothetical protein